MYLIIFAIWAIDNRLQSIISPCQGSSLITSAARPYQVFHTLVMQLLLPVILESHSGGSWWAVHRVIEHSERKEPGEVKKNSMEDGEGEGGKEKASLMWYF